MKKPHTELNRYALSGMAAFLPGMQYMIERMQAELDEFRAQIAALQGTEEPATPTAFESRASKAGKGAWARLTPEERSIEMKRRMAKAKRNKMLKNNPRSKEHPGHAEWAAAVAKTQRARWARMTKAEKEAWAAKMAGAKKRKLKVAS